MTTRPGKQTHVVLGAGQVGPLLAARLAAAGHDVRMVSRTQPRSLPACVQWVSADLTDVSRARAVIRGAHTVYHCANPMRYDRWEVLLPPLSNAIREAASGSGAHLVVLDNLYMYGAAHGGLVSDATPSAPQSRKGELRARLSDQFFAAQQRGDFALSVLRAPDFFGPNSARSSTFHPLFFKQLARNGSVPVMGDPDLPHAHAYTGDVAQALFALGTRAVASIQPWLGPVTWNGTVRELCAVFGRVAGKHVTPRRVPSWLWPVLGVFSPELRAVPDMLHQWNAALRVDDSHFRRAFGEQPSSIEQAVAETLAAYGFASADAPALAPSV